MSTIPAVRAALKSFLSTALGASVQVTSSGVTTLGSRVLYIGRIEGVRSAGSQNRIRTTTRNIPFDTSQDEYTVELIISVSQPGVGETTDVENIADGIWETARNTLEGNLDLSDDGVFELLPTGEFAFDPTADANGRYCTITFGVDVTARD